MTAGAAVAHDHRVHPSCLMPYYTEAASLTGDEMAFGRCNRASTLEVIPRNNISQDAANTTN